ncbi:type IV toxin-antitoxin system AbiEi family antitoxin domain-containing protein [Streptomonospora salina]|uniref:AbiEi antitoxin C-terminal domain-containing protein n=1 Tax=Streptomonospora salina TaxID=104205 RepID=A0A841EM26_9ACTN|nr:type IV toxin-antitoxin system AbiEi family antitoxin domain-containing protein [Streptomonospora salina]MBB6000471.1 hypothetical protein [Streptomonospora salina]
MDWESSFYDLSVAAARQLGLVTRAQAERAGVEAAALDRFEETGMLWELDWSVYQLASSPTDPTPAYSYAAWLAVEPDRFASERPAEAHKGAVLSHESAARLFGLGPVSVAGFDITAPEPVEAPRAVRVHHAALAEHETAVRAGVPATAPQRTVVDLLRSGTGHDEVAAVLGDALRRDLVDLAGLHIELVPFADTCGFPAEGARFAEHFQLDRLAARSELSSRNVRALAELQAPARVTRLTASLRRLGEGGGDGADIAAVSTDPRLLRGIAAEIVGRSGTGA